MNGRSVVRILLVLVVIALALGIGVSVYQAGYAQGAVESGRITTPPIGTAPFVNGPGFYHPFFGFGFGPFGCLFPLLGFLLFFFLLRGLFWGGRRGMHRRWEGGLPPAFDEWHKRAHSEQPAEAQK